MIESNIIKWVDLGDNMQSVDVYSMKKWVKFFNLLRVMINFKKFSIFFYILLKCLFFLQIMMLNLTNVIDSNDYSIQILNYISNVIFVQNIVVDMSSYKIAVSVMCILSLISILCIVYLIISVKMDKFYLKIPLLLLNLINVVVLNYLIGPIINVSIMATQCVNGTHKYLGVECYSDPLHLLFLAISVLNFLFFLLLSVLLSIYYNEVGSINETKFLARINCNYEVYANISKISMFIFSYLVKYYSGEGTTFKIILQVYLLCSNSGFAFYVYKSVLFFDSRMNAVMTFGWIFVSWFSVVVFLKTLLNLTDTSILNISGWLIIACIAYLLESAREVFLLTDFNIFEAKSLKEIELFNLKLFNLLNMRSYKNKTLLSGIIHKFEEVVKSNEDLKDKYDRLTGNKYLQKKFNSGTTLSVLSIVYILYDHHLEKSVLKHEVLLNLCYFLMNRFKNVTYAVYLCSRIKASTHKQMYLKYLLMEEIKDYQINKLLKSNNKESIKHIQIGSVILYNLYVNLFKTRIFDAACSQADYFEMLRSNVTTGKTCEMFLSLGERILELRKEILKLWERICELNPFNEEPAKDYFMYIETILQDDVLQRQESKKFANFKSNKLSDRSNVYHSLFSYTAGTLLVDGYATFGKIIYTTPNFPALFNFSAKDLLNMTIDDLVPNVIRDFHKEVIDNGIRFSNINNVFGTQREMLLKGKTGSIYTVKLFIKCVPNLCYGLIYVVSVNKVVDNSFVVVLDKEFKINGLTDIFSSVAANNYSLDRGVVGSNIGLVIPDMLLHLEYNSVKGFFIDKENVDLKGVLYSVAPSRGLNEKIERLIEKIKLNGKLQVNDENKREAIQEYEETLKEISAKAHLNSSVFYKVNTRVFMGGKHKYHVVNISNDLITMNENSQTFPSHLSSSNVLGTNIQKKRRGNKRLLDSDNQIKIRLNHFGSGEEAQKLIEDGNGNGNGNHNNNNLNHNHNLNKTPHNNNPPEPSHFSSSQQKSALSKSSVDSASFNKLKNGILDKKEVSSIKYMKYLSFAFGIGTILLILFASSQSNAKFSNLANYLQQNLYFNHSKVSVSEIYLNTMNLKLLKSQVYASNRCYKPCQRFYSSLLAQCIVDIKTEKENVSSFYSDFTAVLNKQKQISLSIFNMTEKDQLTIDVVNELNLLVAFGLKLNANLDNYLNSKDPSFDTVSENILTQSLNYANDNSIAGFSNSLKTSNITNEFFSTVNIILIIEGVIFCILIVGFIYLICSLFSLESFYLKKLIKFKNPPFEAYLKKLDEIKKKLRNDSGEDDEKLNADLDLGEFNNSKISKEDDKEDKKKEKKKQSKDDKKKNSKEDIEKKGLKKRKNNKKVVKNYQEEKITIMGNYFLYWNIFFCVKVVTILLLSVSYYLVVSIIDGSTQTQLLNLDAISNSMEDIYKNSFDIYLGLKKELGTFIEAELEKKRLINLLTQNSTSSVTFMNVVYSKADLLSKQRYSMTLPAQVQTPQVGSILMPLVNVADITKASASVIKLNSLYNANACGILFDMNLQNVDYSYCMTFWSSILQKGMEQAITQMSVVVTSVIDDLHSLNAGTKSLATFLAASSPFSGYELFVEFYLFNSYMTTVEIFRKLNADNLQNIYNVYYGIMLAYIIFTVVLFALLIYFVYRSKTIFNTFMNFIGILPAKYLIEDFALYKEILKLEHYIYY